MNNENCVIFKGVKDGISIYFDEAADYEEIKKQMEKKVAEAANFFSDAMVCITLKGKKLTEEQENELLEILTEQTNLSISFLRRENEEDERKALVSSEGMKQFNMAKFFRGNVRSGMEIEFDGSIVIIGDVNPGGVVRAGGNILIMGTLKGMAHAGSEGSSDAFVVALDMRPVQLRIADVITRFPDYSERPERRPEYAYVEDGQIYVLPLV